ncbi:MAG: internal scaffolding protein [Microviridae sp.]|nr:MAG: internal scaffolding protein [Microviridae sp.]
MTKPKLHIRKPHDLSMPVRKSFSLPTMAKQSFQAECDINNIMKKYETTGLISHTNKIQGAYGDFTGVSDYHDAINRVHSANDAFMALPSKIRARFMNEPGNFLAFCEDPANEAEAIALGLLPSKPPSMADEVRPSKPAEKLKAEPPEAANLPGTEDPA